MNTFLLLALLLPIKLLVPSPVQDRDPLACELMRFPSFTEIRAARAFNRAYHVKLLERQKVCSLELAGAYTRAVCENDRYYEVWDTLDDVYVYKHFLDNRTEALERLRDLLGDDAYMSGRMPPSVPLNQFREVP